jgi:hypothetical protein
VFSQQSGKTLVRNSPDPKFSGNLRQPPGVEVRFQKGGANRPQFWDFARYTGQKHDGIVDKKHVIALAAKRSAALQGAVRRPGDQV